jgi:hypothetical protein
MNSDTHLQIGSFHTDHCEDSLVMAFLTDRIRLLAVMDGCSSGTDSFFVATMVAKLLRKYADEDYHLDFREPMRLPLGDWMERIVMQLMRELRGLQNQLQLAREEMLCTLVLALVDEQAQEAEVLVVGDGFVAFNGVVQEFDQDNRPDYLGYHLAEPFAEWWAQQTQRIHVTGVRDLCIATDGVASFRPADLGTYPPIEEAALLDHLLCAPGKFKAKVAELRARHGLAPADDLGMVRWRV